MEIWCSTWCIQKLEFPCGNVAGRSGYAGGTVGVAEVNFIMGHKGLKWFMNSGHKGLKWFVSVKG